MALNIVWVAFFVIAFIVACIKFIFIPGNTDIFKILSDGIFDSAKSSVIDVAFPLAGTMVFFLGIMNIAEKAGAILKLSKLLNPFMKRLFPGIPDNHPSMGHMVMNFSANMLGLDNAATPFGLKAMEGLQEINEEKDTASNAMIMFLVLHTSGLTIIPLSILAYRLASGSHNPASVFIPCVLATVCTTIASILIVAFKQKLKWDKVLVGGILALVTFVSVLMYWVNTMNDEQKNLFGKVAGNVLLLIIIIAIIIGGVVKKLNVFDAFIEGAQHGFGVVLKVIPYFVGMLVAIRVFRDSGSLTYLVNGISYLIGLTGIDTAFTPALPVAIMKPFSGGGARGLMLDTMKTYGADSFVGQLASTFQGSSDTTFYIIALYYGSVGIKKIRYSLWAGIAADMIGVICAILIGYIFFKH